MVDYHRPDRNKPAQPPTPAPTPANSPAQGGPISYSKPNAAPPPAPAPATAPTSAPQSQSAPARPVSLTKVTLTKSEPTVSLTKNGSVSGQMRVNLNWNARQQRKGGLFGGTAQLDLDLGAMYELANGDVGVIQALGRSFGDLHYDPWIYLDGDDRSGSNAGGENLYINLAHADKMRRILVFAYIYEGAPSWDQAQGVITVYPESGPQIEVRLDENAGGARFCAIALLTNNGHDLSLRREVRYINGSQRDVDQAYGFGMRWTGARK